MAVADDIAVVLVSGGWDSLYCAIRARARSPLVLAMHVQYGARYEAEEERAVVQQVARLGLPFYARRLPAIASTDGVFHDRNETLLRCAIEGGATEVWIGVRNPLSILDRYGDSNWSWARKMSAKYGVSIRAPAVGMPKFLITRACRAAGFRDEQVYSTEGVSA
jgi:hypothetical protein